MTDCWEEMARQIKTFKRKLKKVEMLAPIEETKDADVPVSVHDTTHQFIQESWGLGSPHDHKDLLKNLLFVIANDRLTPGSNEFDKICTLVRQWMPISLVQSTQCQNKAGTSIVKNIQIKDTCKYPIFEYYFEFIIRICELLII